MSSRPATQSLLNPYHTSGVKDFNIWYVAIMVIANFYNVISWQGGHAFRASAINAHEAKMGNIMSKWRGYSRSVMIVLLAICAYTYLNLPKYAAGASWVDGSLSHIANKQTADQMRVPLALSHFLPMGIKGLVASIMLFAALACDSSYLHSFGSIFAQDVILPFYKRRLTPEQHIRIIRLSIIAVAVFAYFFGLFFPQTQYLLMYLTITASIFVGGAGSAILGGFYWKKGTTAGAYAGMITGSVLSVAGIVLPYYWHDFPINGQWTYFISMIAAVVMYAIVSLLTYREDFDLDCILHRGKWAVDEQGNPLPPVPKPPRSWKAIIGIDAQFTRADTWTSGLLFAMSIALCLIFVIISAWNFVHAFSTHWWAMYWYVIGIWLPLLLGVITTIWFTIGGMKDLRALFKHLNGVRPDVGDDGTVATDQQEME